MTVQNYNDVPFTTMSPRHCFHMIHIQDYFALNADYIFSEGLLAGA